jgi:tRNA A-37 threonylcarbamoyl transferase component Bud32
VRVDVVTDERGRALAVKRAESRDEAARLRREADLLDAATHPGLVELVDLVEEPELALSTGHLEGGSLAERRGLEVDEVAGAVAAVASTLADLHELGLVHGAVAPEHVLLDGDGRPVLCSLGYGGLAGERRPAAAPVEAAFVDPRRASVDDTLDPSVDVYALGAILSSLLAGANGRPRGGAADALRRLAERCTSALPADRPSARQLADGIHDQVPAARLPGSPGAEPPRPAAARPASPLESWRHAQVPRPRARPPSTRAAGIVVTVAVGLVAGVIMLRSRAVPSSRAEEPPASSTEGPAAEPATTTVAGPPADAAATGVPAPPAHPASTGVPAPDRPVRTTVARAGCAPVAGPLAADVDGDGCPDEVRFANGVVEAAGLRWAVGEADDAVAVGDWSCSGIRSLAVLRTSTGEVFAFTGWATPDHDVGAPLLARVAGARALRAADLDGDGCNELVVERSEGAPAVLRAPGAEK